jgi:5-methylcytosine-specific restriction endonuclease McrA
MATNDQKQKAWDNAATVRGKDPDLYRKDPYGNVMYKQSYGKASEMGWDVDHITPKSRGGSDATRNLQALNSSVNRSKGDTLQKKSRHSK